MKTNAALHFLPLKETELTPLHTYAFNVYEASFPPDERRTIPALRKKIEESADFHFNVILAETEPVGILSYWEWNDWLYVEHFAFDPKQRGVGFGTRTLSLLHDEKQKPIVLEVELPEDEISRRRIKFYERCGFSLWDSFNYIHPPYDATKNALSLYLMVQGAIAPTPENFSGIRDRLHRIVYGVTV